MIKKSDPIHLWSARVDPLGSKGNEEGSLQQELDKCKSHRWRKGQGRFWYSTRQSRQTEFTLATRLDSLILYQSFAGVHQVWGGESIK